MRALPIILRISAFALPLVMAGALALRIAKGPQSANHLAAAAFMFFMTCWIGRFQWRRSFDMEALFGIARVLPSDSAEAKIAVDLLSLGIGVLLVLAVMGVF